MRHAGQAKAVAEGVRAFGSLPVLGLPGSRLLAAAESAGLEPVHEAFADRGYTAAGTLVPRSEPGALLDSTEAAVRRALRLASQGELVAVDGTVLRIAARSLCIHGDTPGAVDMARTVRAKLLAAGCAVQSFVAV
jgi:5-oxoprolinase (ATP-hydrolysing) subunit A